MPSKKKRDEKSESPVPVHPPAGLPGSVKRAPPPPASSNFNFLREEMLKELHGTDQYLRGVFEMKRGNVTRGQYMMGNAITNPMDVNEMNLKGLSLLYESKLEEALSWFEKALGCDPDRPDTINNIGLYYYKQCNYDRAIRQYLLAIAKKGDKALYWWNLALAQMKANQVGNALTSLRRACERDNKLREEAASNEVFESLREDLSFQSIVQSKI